VDCVPLSTPMMSVPHILSDANTRKFIFSFKPFVRFCPWRRSSFLHYAAARAQWSDFLAKWYWYAAAMSLYCFPANQTNENHHSKH